MRTFIHLIATCFISTFCFWGGLGAKTPFLLYGIGFAFWALFLWRLNVRMKRNAIRRYNERMFAEYMRSKSDIRHRSF